LTDSLLYNNSENTLGLRSGDRSAFTDAYNQFYLSIYHYTKKFVDDNQLAEDITADSFVKLWKHAEEVSAIQNVKAFLHTTARNACLDYLKAQRNHEQKEKEILYLTEQDTRNEFDLAEIKAEVLQYVYAEIEKLPEKCKEVFKLAYLEGMKVSEVAQHLNISEQTVANQKTKALKMLRLALSDKQWMVLLLLIADNCH
jgi:RNA polymerase sigma-70 factor (ECF subfamily)